METICFRGKMYLP